MLFRLACCLLRCASVYIQVLIFGLVFRLQIDFLGVVLGYMFILSAVSGCGVAADEVARSCVQAAVLQRMRWYGPLSVSARVYRERFVGT